MASLQLAGRRVIGGKDSCQGDSGGPLLARDGDGAWMQVGVVSQRTGCGFPLFYGIYARVGAPVLHDWIAARLGGTGGGDPAPQPTAPSPGDLRSGKILTRKPGSLVLRVRSSAPVTAALERRRASRVSVAAPSG